MTRFEFYRNSAELIRSFSLGCFFSHALLLFLTHSSLTPPHIHNFNYNKLRRRQVLLAVAVYGQALPTRPRFNDWCRIRRPHDFVRGYASQVANLGHGGAGELSEYH